MKIKYNTAICVKEQEIFNSEMKTQSVLLSLRKKMAKKRRTNSQKKVTILGRKIVKTEGR